MATGKINIAKQVAKREELYFQTKLELLDYEMPISDSPQLSGEKPLNNQFEDIIRRQFGEVVKHQYSTVRIGNLKFTGKLNSKEKRMCNSVIQLKASDDFFQAYIYFPLTLNGKLQIYAIGKMLKSGPPCSIDATISGELRTLSLPYVRGVVEATDYTIMNIDSFVKPALFGDRPTDKYCSSSISSCAL